MGEDIPCSICGKPSSIHLTQITDIQVKKVHFCSACAAKNKTVENSLSPVAHALAVLTKDKAEAPPLYKASTPGCSCPKCGTMAVHFDENHRFGCPECFKVFAQKLQDVIGTIQPGSIHRGRIPSGKEQHAAIEEAIARARDKMGHAIKSENYEEAARLRDEILKLNTMLSQPALD